MSWMPYSGWNEFLDWYDRPPSSELDYNAKQFAKNVPFVGWYLDARDNSRRMNDYLTNRGLGWSDVRYNSAPYGRTYGSVAAQTGSSVMSLYRNTSRSVSSAREKHDREKKQFNRRAQKAMYRYQHRISAKYGGIYTR